jgi:hypothetical protein
LHRGRRPYMARKSCSVAPRKSLLPEVLQKFSFGVKARGAQQALSEVGAPIIERIQNRLVKMLLQRWAQEVEPMDRPEKILHGLRRLYLFDAHRQDRNTLSDARSISR